MSYITKDRFLPYVSGSRAAGLRLEVSHDLDAVRSLWEGFQAHAVATPFQAWSWIAQWAKANNQEPVIALGYEGATLKLILPLAIERRLGARALIWLSQNVSDYNGPLVAPDLLNRLSVEEAASILGEVAGRADVDSLKLEKQPEFLGESRNPFAAYRATGFTCRAHATRLTEDWESFHASKRSRKSAKRLREKASSLSKHGPIAFEEVRDPAERRTVLDKLLYWKTAQLDARGSRNPFRDDAFKRFLLEGASNAALSGLIRIHALKVGGVLAAGALGLQRDGHYIYYVAAYDAERFSRYSPGAILLTQLIETLHREGVSLFDFSNGDERYKDEWCDRSMNLTVTLVPLTLLGRVGIAMEAATLRLIREIKSRPRIFSALRAATSGLRSWRAQLSPLTRFSVGEGDRA